MNPQKEDTICAISTAPGVGGVAMIRVSGPDAAAITGKVYRPAKRFGAWSDQQPYTATYGRIANEEGELIDEVVVTRFAAPHSFTGEEVAEITCHGSLFIQQQIIQLLLRQGCRAAGPGEFTQRAFLNGKMDLSQAEAVADLIASRSAASHRLAMNQMRGGFSRELARLREELLTFVSLIELELDFSEEEVEFADRERLRELVQRISTSIRKLTDSFAVGNAVKNGIPVAIVGETNAGKSTLLNHLLNEERAIVSDVHGTTRDVIEDTMQLQGILFRFIDTAGIRETEDVVESMGISRTFGKIEQASIVLWMIDLTAPAEDIAQLAERIVPLCTDKKLLILLNKADKVSPETVQAREAQLPVDAPHLVIAAKSDNGLDELRDALVQAAQLPETCNNDVIVTNVRHYEALINAQSAIDRVTDGLATNLPGDLLSQDIRECMHYLGEITGEISNDEILGNIFSHFCVGK